MLATRHLRIGSIGVLLVALLVLSACGDRGKHIICPEIRIPQNTDRLVQYREGPGRDITDILVEAEVKFLSGECKIGEDEITLAFPVAVGGRRGPANSTGVSDLTLFLAVSTQDRKILSRRHLPFRLYFPGNRLTIVNAETVQVEIPKTEEQTSDDFLIFLGFELTREQLDFNRTQSRR